VSNISLRYFSAPQWREPKLLVQQRRGVSTYGGGVDTLDRVRAAIQKSGKKQKSVAEDAGMTPGKLSKILRGRQPLLVSDLIAIAGALEIDPARLVSDEETFIPISDLRAAHDAARTAATILGARMPEEGSASAPVVSLRKPEPKRTAQPILAAASSNVELFPEIERKRKTIPRDAWNRKARRIARAKGDSMLGGPDGGIRDGQLVYVKPTRNKRNANGKIVVIRAGDGIYLKTLELIGKRARLISTNPEYLPMEFDDPDELQLIGIVVDKQK
jgi:SOS-response transcriptional repressor LexA